MKSAIVEHGEADPRTLIANPANWRKHGAQQKAAVLGLLSRFGFVEGVVVNRRTGLLIDGHARVEIAIERGAKSVPVTWVDVDEDAEALALLTMDRVRDMATVDADALADLLADDVAHEVDVVVDAVGALRNVRDGVIGSRGRVALFLDPESHVRFLVAVDIVSRRVGLTRVEGVVLHAMREAFGGAA